MTNQEMTKATLGVLWTRLEALEFADDRAANYDEIFRLQDEISRRDRPWARLEASFEAALEDEYNDRMGV